MVAVDFVGEFGCFAEFFLAVFRKNRHCGFEHGFAVFECVVEREVHPFDVGFSFL